MRTPASPRSAQHAPPSLFCADHYRRPSALRLSPPRRAPSRTGRPDASELGYGLSTVELLGDEDRVESLLRELSDNLAVTKKTHSRLFFERFPYACPEPVLVERPF